MKKYKLSILAVHSLGIVGFVLMSPVLPDVPGRIPERRFCRCADAGHAARDLFTCGRTDFRLDEQLCRKASSDSDRPYSLSEPADSADMLLRNSGSYFYAVP